MIKSNGVEHWDNLVSHIVFWCNVTDIPAELIEKAKNIDKENFDLSCFGTCVILNEIGFSLMQYSPNSELYYTANDGTRHWLDYTFTDEECVSFFKDCLEDITTSLLY